MNTTNCTTITEVLGSPDINDWIGKQIVLHTEKVRGFGKITDAVRVMNKKPKTLTCEDCGETIVPAGSWNAEKVAAESKRLFGHQLCAKCAGVRSKEVKNNDAADA